MLSYTLQLEPCLLPDIGRSPFNSDRPLITNLIRIPADKDLHYGTDVEKELLVFKKINLFVNAEKLYNHRYQEFA